MRKNLFFFVCFFVGGGGGVLIMSNTNRLYIHRLKFQITEVEGLYYLYSENK